MSLYISNHQVIIKNNKLKSQDLEQYFIDHFTNDNPSNEDMHELFYKTMFGLNTLRFIKGKRLSHPITNAFVKTNSQTSFFDNWNQKRVNEYRELMSFWSVVGKYISLLPIEIVEYLPAESLVIVARDINNFQNKGIINYLKNYFISNFENVFRLDNPVEDVLLAPGKTFWILIENGFTLSLKQFEELVQSKTILLEDKDYFVKPILEYLEKGEIYVDMTAEKSHSDILSKYFSMFDNLSDAAVLRLEMNI